MVDNATNECSLQGYRALLIGLFGRGYTARDLSNSDPQLPHLRRRREVPSHAFARNCSVFEDGGTS